MRNKEELKTVRKTVLMTESLAKDSSALISSQVNFRCFIAHTKKIFNAVTFIRTLSSIPSAISTVR